VELTVLGASGTHPTPEHACSGYLLRHEGYTAWVDAGNGTLARLQEHVAMGDVDAIWLSHAHPDHCADLYPFFYALLMDPGGASVPVYTPHGVREKLAHLIGEDSVERFNTRLAWRPLQPGESVEAGPFTFEAFEAAHSTANNSLRASTAGRVLCYSGDTGPNEHLAAAAEDADLFLCEASWVESDAGLMAPIHLRASEAGRVASQAGAKRLALTHIWPRNDLGEVKEQAGDAYGGHVEIAREARGFEI